MSAPGGFEIDKEYDQRYEGFDYDDVDEAATAPRPSRHDAEEEAFEEALAAAAAAVSPGATGDPFAALERAEQDYEQDQARKKPGKRLLERLEGEEGRRVKPAGGGGGVGAAALLTSQKRIAAALAANERLKDIVSNPQAAAAALTLAAAPLGASKTAGLGRLAASLRGASAAANSADLDKSTAPKTFKEAFLSLKKLKGTLQGALAAADAGAAHEEEAVRLLLTLATAPVTANALERCGQAGKRVRKLKKESGSEAVVGAAAAVVVDAWKATIMGRDSANKDN
jgi:hypothetical protein